MNFLEETFVIIHIRISGIKFYFLKMRTIVTISLILFLIFSSMQIYNLLVIGPFTFLAFVQDIVYSFIVLYTSLLWVKTWTKANKHLNQAIKEEGIKKKNDDK